MRNERAPVRSPEAKNNYRCAPTHGTLFSIQINLVTRSASGCASTIPVTNPRAGGMRCAGHEGILPADTLWMNASCLFSPDQKKDLLARLKTRWVSRRDGQATLYCAVTLIHGIGFLLTMEIMQKTIFPNQDHHVEDGQGGAPGSLEANSCKAGISERPEPRNSL